MLRWLVPMGRIFYAIGLIGIGVQHFIFADFITVILPSWPASIPGRLLFAYATGAALVAAGAAIIFAGRARTVAAITGAVLLALVVIVQVPAQMAVNPGQLAAWTHAFKELTLCGGAWSSPSLYPGRA